jgi:hypothetical protein
MDKIFPDKLKNMKGYTYKVLGYFSYPTFFVLKDSNHGVRFDGIGYRFLETVARHQNAKCNVTSYLNTTNGVITSTFSQKLRGKMVDMVINPEVQFVGELRKLAKYVNTFDTGGFCALIPHPERKSFFAYFIEPFDNLTWISILVSLVGLVVVWHLLNKIGRETNPNSAGYFLFAFVSYFLGQGVDFREHRWIQKLLILIMIIATSILGNFYQSDLISLMAESRNGDRITTVQGMIESNFTFKVDQIFMSMFKYSEKDQKLRDKITGTIDHLISTVNFEQLSEEKIGLIVECNTADILYQKKEKHFAANVSEAIDFHYKVPILLYPYYKKFPVVAFSFFTERLQEFSLRVFESGIKQLWRAHLGLEDMESVRTRESEANEDFLLNLGDMTGAFYCLVIGCVVSLIAFGLEISKEKFKWRKMKNCMKFFRRKRVAPQAWA